VLEKGVEKWKKGHDHLATQRPSGHHLMSFRPIFFLSICSRFSISSLPAPEHFEKKKKEKSDH